MTLTVCVGSSGSGKTTFLNDVHKSHKCTYIRQYHNLRPFIAVSAIPNFDPTKLPYWDIYMTEKKAHNIIVGGTIAGQFMAGLSGGQRKLLLFELIFQRTLQQDNLLIVLDEPFAGVTDDFVPFIVERLNEMRKAHNILLVTNDHVNTLKKMADNTVTVSAIDRSTVKINGKEGVDRELALLAMSIGDAYQHTASNKDLKFFRDVEFSKQGGILTVVVFVVFTYGLFLLMFWDSEEGSEALVLIAGGLITYLCVNPYFLQLVDWRIFMMEEAEALLHSSKTMNKTLKTLLTLGLLFVITLVQFGCMEAVLGTLTTVEFFIAILFDNLSLSIMFICLGLYTDLSDQAVQIFGTLPFLFMIFFSTTFSPGAGVRGMKELRYLFSRFYLWCMLPDDVVEMEECPESNTLLYLVLASLFTPFCFVVAKLGMSFYANRHQSKGKATQRESMKTLEFAELQLELFGEKSLKNLKDLGSSVSNENLQKLAETLSGGRGTGDAESKISKNDNKKGDKNRKRSKISKKGSKSASPSFSSTDSTSPSIAMTETGGTVGRTESKIGKNDNKKGDKDRKSNKSKIGKKGSKSASPSFSPTDSISPSTAMPETEGTVGRTESKVSRNDNKKGDKDRKSNKSKISKKGSKSASPSFSPTDSTLSTAMPVTVSTVGRAESKVTKNDNKKGDKDSESNRSKISKKGSKSASPSFSPSDSTSPSTTAMPVALTTVVRAVK